MTLQAPNMKVLGARLVVVEDIRDEAVRGIILPERLQEKPMKGIVVAVGQGAYTFEGDRIPMDVKLGDQVVWTNIAGVPIKIENTTYLVINESHIIAITGNEEVLPYAEV